MNYAAQKKRTEAIKRMRTAFDIEPLEAVIRNAIKHAWQATGHDKELTARALGIGRSTLYRKLEKYGFDEWT